MDEYGLSMAMNPLWVDRRKKFAESFEHKMTRLREIRSRAVVRMIRQFFYSIDDKPDARNSENCRIMLTARYIIMIFLMRNK